MRRVVANLIVLAVACAIPIFGSTAVFLNTTTDTADTIIYSNLFVTQFGDQIHLAGTERVATFALVQLYNQGDAGTADVTLRLFNVGAPVGGQIGPDFVQTGVAVSGVTNVGFNLPNLAVPDDLIFTVSFANQLGGVNIVGLDMFEPPTVGSSDNTFGIGFDGTNFNTYPTNGFDSSLNENVFFELDANSPEPGTLGLVAAALGIAAVVRRRKLA
jgi:hypothetical protein